MKQALKCDFTWADFKTNSDGMVPVVVQDAENDEVLMLAYMNEEAFETTLCLGKMTYWSRSRNELWTKGLSSGHVQYVKQLLIDCDNDTILAKVEQVGAACHTGNRTCFYRTLADHAEDPGCKNSPEDVSLYIAYDKNGGEDNTDDCEQNGDSDIVKRSCHILCSV